MDNRMPLITDAAAVGMVMFVAVFTSESRKQGGLHVRFRGWSCVTAVNFV